MHYTLGGVQVAMSKEELQALLTVKEVAEMHDVPARVVRKAVKNGTIPGAVEVLGRTGFDPDLVANWTPPEPGTRVVGARREDGRRRYRIYLTPDEAAKLLVEGYEVSDPREAAKARRAAKKEGQGAEAQGGEEAPAENEDLFADFEA
jgi:hypothetical protein